MSKENEIPLYTRIGSKVTIILLLILTAIILKNCIGAFIYGTITDREAITHYYELGYADGSRQAGGSAVEEPRLDNPLLKKAYRQGFRKGWDSVSKSESEQAAGEMKVE